MRRYKVVICRGPTCGGLRGSEALHEVFRAKLDALGMTDRVELAWQSCFGFCTRGPNVMVREILTSEPAFGSGFATLPGPRGRASLYNQCDAERAELIAARLKDES
ncbi:MAG TPA: (2Fe-2S) ferredoxin domain-containing protein [Kofleriaceae bacterium]